MKRGRVWGILPILWVGFIFWNSLYSGTASDDMSTKVLMWLHALPGTSWITGFIVRKTAHFTEFWVLGALLSLYAHVRAPAVQERFVMPLLGVLQTAVIDETIQCFIPGRTGMVRDVLIDFSGGICATLIVAVPLWQLWKRRQASKVPNPRPAHDRRRKRLFAALAILLCFIWGNSMLNSQVSNKISEASLRIVESVKDAIEKNDLIKTVIGNTGTILNNHRMRKIGHFSEYFFLGMLLFLMVGGNRRKPRVYWHLMWLLALIVPVADEGIQLFSKGRTPLVTDIWIDFAGILCGAFLIFTPRWLEYKEPQDIRQFRD